MARYTLTATAHNSPASPPWFFPQYMFVDEPEVPPFFESNYGYHNGSNSNVWVALRLFDTVIPNKPITGIKVEARVRMGINEDGLPDAIPPEPPPNTYRLQLALSKDGINPAGTVWTHDLAVDPEIFTIGGYGEMHGTTWLRDQINDEDFALLMRVPTHLAGENITGVKRSIDYARLQVYTDEPFNILTGEGGCDGEVDLDW